MKVLQLFGGMIRHGGEEMFVYNYLKRFDYSGFEFDVMVIEDCENDDFKSLIHSHGGELYELKTPLHATNFSNHIYKPVCEFFSKHKYDVVHIHSSSIAALALLAAAADKSGTPKVIVHSHSTGKSDSFVHKLFRFSASRSLRKHADVYCACSKPAAEWKFAPKYAAKAIIVNNGIDCERFRFSPQKRAETRRRLNIPDGTFVICNTGRLCALKNQELLINALDIVKNDISDSRLLLLGDGEDRNRLVALAKEKGLADRVIFTGNVDDVENYLSAADVFAFPSEYEGLGIAAIEAQCAGLPVVASDGVPAEIKLTDDVEFIGIAGETAAQSWAERLCAYRYARRRDKADEVRSNGYDIGNTAAEIRKLYLQ